MVSMVHMRWQQTGWRSAAIPGVHDGVALELSKLATQPGDTIDVVDILQSCSVGRMTINLMTCSSFVNV